MRYFYLTALILCLCAVQESSFSGVKSTVHPKLHGNKPNEHDHGARKPQSSMRHFQNEKGRYVKDEKLKEAGHIKEDKVKEGRHLKDDKVKAGRHAKDEKLKEVRLLQDEKLKEVRHIKYDQVKEEKHVKDKKIKEVRHLQDDKLKEARHIKYDQVKEGRHVKDEKIKQVKNLQDEKLKEARHIKYDQVKEGRHVNEDKIKVSTSQNITRKHPKEIRHFQNEKRENLKNEKSKVTSSEKNVKTFENVTTHKQHLKLEPGVPVIKLPDKILHNRKGRITGKHLYGNRTSQNRKPKKSKYHKTEDDKSKPGFRAHGSSDSSSETEEIWPEEWDDHWMQKKMEALNSTQLRGDVINMAGARPWAFPCGDPGQHDRPWGTCMLAAECDAEYRIYRGDSFCGRTSLVCCALQISNYDFYNGIDVSFGGTSFSSDSKDDIIKIAGSKELKKRLEKKAKDKRKQERIKRKKRMQKSIKTIVQEVKKILNRAYKNGTSERQRKVNRIREYINNMKKQYRQDRKNLLKLHHEELLVADEKLQSKLSQVRGVNEAFMNNDTFRNIIVNGTINKSNLMMLLRANPQLTQYFKTRRSGGGESHPRPAQEAVELEVLDANSKTQEYDLEYGVLYY